MPQFTELSEAKRPGQLSEESFEGKQSERHFRALADSIPQLCWIANSEGLIDWYNRRWTEYTGKTAEQMRGKKWAPVVESDAQPGLLARWLESVATGKPFDMVISIKGKDGRSR